jgi:hypothetical protein
VINISNYASKDNPTQPVPAGRVARTRIWDVLTLAVGVAVDWLAYFLRRWGDRQFAVNDAEAYWWSWQIAKTLGGLGRRYRDIRFDTLAACARCTGAGRCGDEPCEPCLGTGRVTLGEAS